MTECRNIITNDEKALRKKPSPDAERELSMKKQAFEIMKRHVDEVAELKKPTTGGARAGGPDRPQFATLESLRCVSLVSCS